MVKKEKQDVQDPPDAPGGEQPVGEEPRTFTDEQMQNIVQKRLAAERKKFEDYDDLKAQAEKWAEFEESQKTELEKAHSRTAAVEAERDKALETGRTQALQASVMSAAALAGAAHPGDAFALVDLAGLSIGDDGKVTGATEAVKVLVEAGRLVISGKPHAPGLDGGAGAGDRPGDKKLVLSAEELQAAEKMGVTAEQYAKAKKGK